MFQILIPCIAGKEMTFGGEDGFLEQDNLVTKEDLKYYFKKLPPSKCTKACYDTEEIIQKCICTGTKRKM